MVNRHNIRKNSLSNLSETGIILTLIEWPGALSIIESKLPMYLNAQINFDFSWFPETP
jgi:hypothetical protein